MILKSDCVDLTQKLNKVHKRALRVDLPVRQAERARETEIDRQRHRQTQKRDRDRHRGTEGEREERTTEQEAKEGVQRERQKRQSLTRLQVRCSTCGAPVTNGKTVDDGKRKRDTHTAKIAKTGK